MVAALISGFSACWAQPVISATRLVRTPTAGFTPGSSCAIGGAILGGARSIIAPSLPGIRRRNGFASFAPASASRKRPG